MIWAWEIDTATSHGAGHARLLMKLFNEALLSLRGTPARPGVLVAKALKMYRLIEAYRIEHGRRTADEKLASAVRFGRAVVDELLAGR